MDSWWLIGTILGIHVLAWMTPGPMFILIVRNSLIYSHKTGIWTALGIGLANVIHVAYSVFGVGVIVSTSALAFAVVKFLGAAYLAYLGIKTFLGNGVAKNVNAQGDGKKDISPFAAVKMGLIANLLSPKAMLFYISIFAAVAASNAGDRVIAILWMAMPLNSFLMAALLSLIFTHAKVRAFYAKYHKIANGVLGIALLAFAVSVAVQ